MHKKALHHLMKAQEVLAKMTEKQEQKKPAQHKAAHHKAAHKTAYSAKHK